MESEFTYKNLTDFINTDSKLDFEVRKNEGKRDSSNPKEIQNFARGYSNLKYKGLRVKANTGTGRPAFIPFISFLGRIKPLEKVFTHVSYFTHLRIF